MPGKASATGRRASKAAPRRSQPVRLAEPLSPSERRVLGYLPTNLPVPDIARELFGVGEHVETHIRHLFAKLDAHRRAEAVKRARALGLLTPSPPAT